MHYQKEINEALNRIRSEIGGIVQLLAQMNDTLEDATKQNLSKKKTCKCQSIAPTNVRYFCNKCGGEIAGE